MMAELPAAPEPARLFGRGLPYLSFSLLLHALLLAWPSLGAYRRATPPPVDILAVTLVTAPTPLPAASAAVPSVEPLAVPPPPRARAAHTPRSAVVAVSRNDTPFAVPAAPVAAAPASTPAAGDGSPPAVPSATSAPRFDAAYLHNPAPSYPPASRRLGEEGRVHLRVRVGPDGRPVAVDVEKGSNFERLDEAARATVARWRFVPARRADEPVEGLVVVPIVFRLDE